MCPPDVYKVMRITSAGETLYANWVEVVDADVTSTGLMQIRHSRRLQRFSATKQWANLIRLGWKRVPQQW